MRAHEWTKLQAGEYVSNAGFVAAYFPEENLWKLLEGEEYRAAYPRLKDAQAAADALREYRAAVASLANLRETPARTVEGWKERIARLESKLESAGLGLAKAALEGNPLYELESFGRHFAAAAELDWLRYLVSETEEQGRDVNELVEKAQSYLLNMARSTSRSTSPIHNLVEEEKRVQLAELLSGWDITMLTSLDGYVEQAERRLEKAERALDEYSLAGWAEVA